MTRADNAVAVERLEHTAAAQARRDRAKLVAVHKEVAELRTKVSMLEGSLSRRAGGPARRVIRLLRRVRTRLSGPAEQDQAAAQPQPGRGLALVIDHHWPQPDRDSGSIDIVNLVQALRQLGFETILAASREHEADQPARARLMAQGVRCLQPDEATSVEAFIRQHGPTIVLGVMCRVYCGGEFLELLQQHAWQARLVFNSIDLNFVREERRAQLLQDEATLAIVAQLRRREEHLIASSDMTFVVSTTEQNLLAQTMPECLVVRLPLARPVHRPAKKFAERSGIGFIGGFEHAPNLDAVNYFLEAIWPSIRRALPGCEFRIVGAGAPEGLASNHENVVVLGHQADVEPWFESLRVTVAPLRYGAGAKGKVASSLAHGVPCIVTSIASEGMRLVDEAGVLIRDDPEEFAKAVLQAYVDEDYWGSLSSAGVACAEQMLSLDAWRMHLDRVVRLVGI